MSSLKMDVDGNADGSDENRLLMDRITNGGTANSQSKNSVIAILQILRQLNFKNTEEMLQKEANMPTDIVTVSSEMDVNKVLSVYKSEGDPNGYSIAYSDLVNFIESSLDIYKHELGTTLYPVFVHMYLELVYNNYSEEAAKFMKKYGPMQEDYYQQDVKKFALVLKADHMIGNPIIETFKNNSFTVRMSRDTLSILKRHLRDKEHGVMLNIIKKHLYFDMYEGVARNKRQIEVTAGGMLGETKREDNKIKVFYGLLKEPDLQCLLPSNEDEDMENMETDRPKKKRSKKDPIFSKKSKLDPNAPPNDRMPFPEMRDSEKLEKLKSLRESTKRITLSPESLPCAICYTVLNTKRIVCCAEISEDVSTLAVGFADSKIQIWSLVPQKLKALKTASELQELNMEAEDINIRMMDDKTAETSKALIGHYGAVYRVSFNPDRVLLVSCSSDATIRLWCLLLWRCLVVYKGHCSPVWDVQFSPFGYYFASCGADRTARLWATDNHCPLRIFTGHFADVHCVKFHPNSNYLATGSSDRSVRLWDCVAGTQVRMMTGHKGIITTLCYSNEGRFLVSGGTDTDVLIWDIASGHLVGLFAGHTDYIYAMSFSREGNVLATGSHNCSIKLWDFMKFSNDISLDDVNVCHNPDVKKNKNNYLIRTLGTKQSPVIDLMFSMRNILFTVVAFDPDMELS